MILEKALQNTVQLKVHLLRSFDWQVQAPERERESMSCATPKLTAPEQGETVRLRGSALGSRKPPQ